MNKFILKQIHICSSYRVNLMINYSERSKFSNFKYVYTVVALKSITMLLITYN